MNEPNADAIYDELKIYQEAFSSADILNEYKKNSKNGNIKIKSLNFLNFYWKLFKNLYKIKDENWSFFRELFLADK